MIRGGEQILHLAVSLNDIILGLVHVFTQLFDAGILTSDFSVEVLCFILRSLDDANDLINLVVLIFDHAFLVREHLTIIEIASLIELAIFTADILLMTSILTAGWLLIFNTAVFLCELSFYHLSELLDKPNAPTYFLLAELVMLVRRISIFVLKLFHVVHIVLQSRKSCLRHIFITGNGLARRSLLYCINLLAQTFDALL